ncbi:MAG: hypothetical protein HYT75_02815 [Deltaproteobacteria bacterium]|nr:hypothetical protein [Deltaproteobacteria bacterium]
MSSIKFICFDVNGVFGRFDENAWLEHVAESNRVFPETLKFYYNTLKLLPWHGSWFFNGENLLERALHGAGQGGYHGAFVSPAKAITPIEGMRLILLALRSQRYFIGLYSDALPWNSFGQEAIDTMASFVGTKDIASDVASKCDEQKCNWNRYIHSLSELTDRLRTNGPKVMQVHGISETGSAHKFAPDEILFISEERSKLKDAKNAGINNVLLFNNPRQLRRELLQHYKIETHEPAHSDKCLDGVNVSPKEIRTLAPNLMSRFSINDCENKRARVTIVFDVNSGMGYRAYIRSRDGFFIAGSGAGPVKMVVEITPTSDKQLFLFGTVATTP